MLFITMRILVTTVVILASIHMIPGLEVKDTLDAFFFGLILGVVNSVVRPILTLLTLPITFLTLGIFLIVINAFTFWLASEMSYGVHISSFWGACLGGFIILVTGIFTNRLIWKSHLY